MKLATRGLTKHFGKLTAVDHIDLEIAEGSITGFIGPNGAGKSTTMKMMATLLEPDAGTVTFDGRDIWRERDAYRRRFGYMPDFFGLYGKLTVHEYLNFYARCYRIPAAEIARRIDRVVEQTAYAFPLDTDVQALSRGMSQKVLLAKTLLHDPDLLILDEPASGLDPLARDEVMQLLVRLREQGKTVFISSHILKELADICTHVVIIEKGKLVEQESLSLAAAAPPVVFLAGAVDAAGLAARQAALGIASFVPAEDGWELTLAAGASPDDLLRGLVEQRISVRRFAVRAKRDLEQLLREAGRD